MSGTKNMSQNGDDNFSSAVTQISDPHALLWITPVSHSLTLNCPNPQVFTSHHPNLTGVHLVSLPIPRAFTLYLNYVSCQANSNAINVIHSDTFLGRDFDGRGSDRCRTAFARSIHLTIAVGRR